jgi:hypothetical protein
VTQLLDQIGGGDRRAADELLPLVYAEMQRPARREHDGGQPRIVFTDDLIGEKPKLDELLDLDRALERFRRIDPRRAL